MVDIHPIPDYEMPGITPKASASNAENKTFGDRYNREMVQLERLEEDDRTMIYFLLNKHYKYTGSVIADNILRHFDEKIDKFVKVMPVEYRNMLNVKRNEKKLDLLEVYDG